MGEPVNLQTEADGNLIRGDFTVPLTLYWVHFDVLRWQKFRRGAEHYHRTLQVRLTDKRRLRAGAEQTLAYFRGEVPAPRHWDRVKTLELGRRRVHLTLTRWEDGNRCVRVLLIVRERWAMP